MGDNDRQVRRRVEGRLSFGDLGSDVSRILLSFLPTRELQASRCVSDYFGVLVSEALSMPRRVFIPRRVRTHVAHARVARHPAARASYRHAENKVWASYLQTVPHATRFYYAPDHIDDAFISAGFPTPLAEAHVPAQCTALLRDRGQMLTSLKLRSVPPRRQQLLFSRFPNIRELRLGTRCQSPDRHGLSMDTFLDQTNWFYLTDFSFLRHVPHLEVFHCHSQVSITRPDYPVFGALRALRELVLPSCSSVDDGGYIEQQPGLRLFLTSLPACLEVLDIGAACVSIGEDGAELIHAQFPNLKALYQLEFYGYDVLSMLPPLRSVNFRHDRGITSFPPNNYETVEDIPRVSPCSNSLVDQECLVKINACFPNLTALHLHFREHDVSASFQNAVPGGIKFPTLPRLERVRLDRMAINAHACGWIGTIRRLSVLELRKPHMFASFQQLGSALAMTKVKAVILREVSKPESDTSAPRVDTVDINEFLRPFNNIERTWGPGGADNLGLRLLCVFPVEADVVQHRSAFAGLRSLIVPGYDVDEDDVWTASGGLKSTARIRQTYDEVDPFEGRLSFRTMPV